MATTQHNVRAKVREAARNERVILTEHARQRMRERGVTIQQITHVLIYGEEIETQPSGNPEQNPLTKLRGEASGDQVTVVASVKELRNGGAAVVVTAWK